MSKNILKQLLLTLTFLSNVPERCNGEVRHTQSHPYPKVERLLPEKPRSSIYDLLETNGLPMGLLPKGVTNYTIDDSGFFKVYLEKACNSKFENEFHYDQNVSGTLKFGQIDGVNGISAQDLFMWFNVKEIRVDIPSSGLIYFDVGVVHKQFSLSSFDTPRDCLAFAIENSNQLITEVVPKRLSRKLGNHKHYQQEHSMAAL